MKRKLRISAVSYINSLPFVYGIKESGYLRNYSLSLDIPSVCAEKLIKGKVDIGLAPVAILPKLKKYFIVPGFCIGSDGPVRSVMLYSDVPLRRIQNLYLDNQSRTSVLLVKILAAHFWKIAPRLIDAKPGYEKKIKGVSAGLIIGDRNFSIKRKYKFTYDLSSEWKKFTGLPFVFACWISSDRMDPRTLHAFSRALKFGLDNRREVLGKISKRLDKNKIKSYLLNNIRYDFDEAKQEALRLFLKLGKEIA